MSELESIGRSNITWPASPATDLGQTVLNEWRKSFSNLLNSETEVNLNESMLLTDEIDERTPSYLNESTTVEETLKALTKLKCNKAVGFDNIPAEVIKSQRLQNILCALFHLRFINGVIPSAWKKGVIHPIPKSSTAD